MRIKRRSIYTYLRDRSANPYGVEDGIGEETLEDVPLTMDLAGVYLVEERHHYERVEDYCKMLCWF